MTTEERIGAAVRDVAVLHGADLAYIWYPGTGTPLVMLHGVGSSAQGWDAAARILSGRGIGVLSIDLPGHGESGKGPGTTHWGRWPARCATCSITWG